MELESVCDEECLPENLELTATEKMGTKVTEKACPKETAKQKALLSEVDFVASCTI